jgi:type II secretory pathway pseudopilin PulG
VAAARGEAGFTLAESAVAVGVVAIGAGGVVAALLSVMRPTAEQIASATLTTTAQNVLSDLRAATAYGTTSLSSLAGKRTSFAIRELRPDGTAQAISVTEAFAADAGGVAVTLTCADASGRTVAVTAPLVREAPEPGAVMTADPALRYEPSPTPQPTIPPGPWRSPGHGCDGGNCPRPGPGPHGQ